MKRVCVWAGEGGRCSMLGITCYDKCRVGATYLYELEKKLGWTRKKKTGEAVKNEQ